MSTRAFQNFLQSPELARLAKLAAGQRQLEKLWRSTLPAGFAGLSEAVGIEGDCLEVSTRSAAVASKLRQMEARLVLQLNDKGLKINAIRCRIQVERRSHEQKKPPKNLTISAPALAILQEAADTLPPSPLRDAFAELVAKRQKR
ncbi:DciA family protein [Chitinimonas naiadis]